MSCADCLRASLPTAARRYASWLEDAAAGRAEPILIEHGPLRLPPAVLNATLASGEPAELAQLGPLLCKLCRGVPVRIGAAGASVTFAHGIRQNRTAAWPAVLGRGLDAAWGGRGLVSVRNGAAPATGAGFAALCFDTLFPEPLDLLVVEYSLTTAHASKLRPLLDEARRRGVRALGLDLHQLVASRPWDWCGLRALVTGQAQRYRGVSAKTGKACTINNTISVPSAYSRAALLGAYRAYALPVVSQYAVAQWGLGALPPAATAAAAREGAPPPTLAELARWVSPDGRHATRAAHVQLGRMLLHAVRTAHAALAASAPATRRQGGGFGAPLKGAAADMIAGGTYGAAEAGAAAPPPVPRDSTCSVGARLLDLVQPARSSGFRFAVENDKAGLLADRPGATLSLILNATAASLRAAAANGTARGAARTAAFLSFLKSYEHMGRAAVACAGGCACDGVVVEGHHQRHVSLHVTLPPLELRPAAPSGGGGGGLGGDEPCVLRVAVLANSSSGEHKVKLTALTLAPARLRRVVTKRTASHFGDLGALLDEHQRSV